MTYSIIGILAGIILVITNRDVLLLSGSPKSLPILRKYRSFLVAVLTYYITDALWGILNAQRLTSLQFLDTTLYFVAMAALVLLWTRYVIAYLEGHTWLDTMLWYGGWAFFVFEIIVIIANLFHPVMFWFDESGAYHTELFRHVTLYVQILMFLLTSLLHPWHNLTDQRESLAKESRHRLVWHLNDRANLFSNPLPVMAFLRHGMHGRDVPPAQFRRGRRERRISQ